MRFGPIAAQLHGAPSPAAILAVVEKQPQAFCVGAMADAGDRGTHQQVTAAVVFNLEAPLVATGVLIRMQASADVMNSLEFLQQLCAELAPDDHAFSGEPRHAAVCVLVAEVERVPSICFIRRAKWDGDPWSEHIALPGGSRTGEENIVETVRREVREEIGVAIADNGDLIPLPRLRIRLAGRERLMLLDAFVHHCTGTPPSLRPGPEVDSAFWIPLVELWNSRNLDHLALGDNADTLVYPAVRIPQGMIFGITLRVLTLLSDRLGMPLHYLEEIPMLRRKGPGS